MITAIVTRGFGSWGSITLIVGRGFTSGPLTPIVHGPLFVEMGQVYQGGAEAGQVHYGDN